MSNIVELADALRLRCEGAIKRNSDFALYGVLAGILQLCEMDASAHSELREECKNKQLVTDKNRTYFETKSDIFIVACRYVFNNEKKYANISRYATSLRIASEDKGVTSENLVTYLSKNGGINALYLSRPMIRTTVKTKCLRLANEITVDKNKEFTIRLIRLSDNTYKVLEFNGDT